ncbi:MAG: cytochrome c [Bacteroidota bacterium]
MKAAQAFLISIVIALMSAALGPDCRAQSAADDFRQNCISCHTIGGGRLTGPDLKNVEQRKDRAWLVRFIGDPAAVIASGDAYALKLKDEARGTIMPTLPGMTSKRLEAILDLVAEESKLEVSNFKGIQINERPFTAQDIVDGRAYFTGTRELLNGGPSCISCHTTNDIGGLGGGLLGPDLTAVFERYEGRRTLSTWLSAPALPTMKAVFGNHSLTADEVLALVAYFEKELQRSPRSSGTARLNFILIGLGGAIVCLGLFDVFWKKRFRAVRRPMVASMRRKTTEDSH